MSRDSFVLTLILICNLFPSTAAANQEKSVDVERSSCVNYTHECRSPYIFSDVSDYVKGFEFHPNTIVSRASIKSSINLGPSNLRRGDILHFNSNGEIIEIWSGYRRKIAGIGVWSETSYPVHPNGSIASIKLANSQLIDSKFYPRQANVSFDINGRVIKDDFYPTEPVAKSVEQGFNQKIHGMDETINFAELIVPKNSQITVTIKGEISSVSLSGGLWVNELYYPANTQLNVNREGRLEIDVLYSHLSTGEVQLNIQAYAELLTKPLTIGAITFPIGTLVERNASFYTSAHLLEKTNVCGFIRQGESITLQAYNNGSYTLSMKFEEVELKRYNLPKKRSPKHDQVRAELHDNCRVKSIYWTDW